LVFLSLFFGGGWLARTYNLEVARDLRYPMRIGRYAETDTEMTYTGVVIVFFVFMLTYRTYNFFEEKDPKRNFLWNLWFFGIIVHEIGGWLLEPIFDLAGWFDWILGWGWTILMLYVGGHIYSRWKKKTGAETSAP